MYDGLKKQLQPAGFKRAVILHSMCWLLMSLSDSKSAIA